MTHPEPQIATTLLYLLAALVLVALNGFFVAAEFAIVKVRRTRLEELAGKGVHAARISILCVDRLDEYLSATQIGITIVSLALGWIGEESFYNLFRILVPAVADSANIVLHAAAAGLSFCVITALHIVFGELVPKSMAIQSAEDVAMRVSGPLRFFFRLVFPFITALTWVSNLILRVLGYRGAEEPPLSEEELKLVMKESRADGVITESEAQIITRAFEFADKRASDIMIPFDKVDYLSLSRSFDENIVVTQRRLHTRFPLCEAGPDTVVGTVHMKDAWPKLALARTNEVFRQVARPAVFVDASIRQDQLMKLFKEKRAHLAIVQKLSHGARHYVGIVTMEDILEELVGDIQDEYGN